KEEEEVDASFNNLLDLVEGGSQKEHGGAEFSLIVANQGAEGVKLARQALEAGRPFFVAFIDMRMPPGIDGLETAKQLRAIDERIFIVIVTAYSDTDHEEIHQQLGYGFFYLKKPFAASEIHQLARTLKQLWQNSTPVSLLAEPEQKTELQQEAPQTDTPNVKQPTKEAHSQVQGRVLVAEDTPEMQLLIKKVVERSGATVSVAENGQEAIEVALQDSFDLILMDMQMPIMDGIEATALLRSMGYDEPIVALTANVMQKDRDRFFEAGCDQYLNKPINMYAINGVLHQYLTESGQVEEREVSVVDDEMRSIFLARLAEIDQELTQLEGTESWEQLRLIAHNMKGSGATFGFPELSKLGREVCDAIDNSQHDSLPRLEGKLIAEISKTLIRSG
ncbi:MAG: response regulator, partial [Gammaproteobacteria bacterium]|nr:response regulator [Gammaproteobacteria bacterium]